MQAMLLPNSEFLSSSYESRCSGTRGTRLGRSASQIAQIVNFCTSELHVLLMFARLLRSIRSEQNTLFVVEVYGNKMKNDACIEENSAMIDQGICGHFSHQSQAVLRF